MKNNHNSPNPKCFTYAGVLSCESIDISLAYASIINLDVVVTIVQNMYLWTAISGKNYIISTDEFEIQCEGCIAITTYFLFGEKYTGRDYRLDMHSLMNNIWLKLFSDGSDV